MPSKGVQSVLRRLGSTRPLVLVIAYTSCASVIAAVSEIARGSSLGATIVAILSLLLLSVLFVTVTWFRDDDWLAAGVLMTLTTYAAYAIRGMLMLAFHGGIGPAALWGAVTAGGAIVYAIIVAPVAGGLVALARRLTDSRATA
jgi:hypothetical protein